MFLVGIFIANCASINLKIGLYIEWTNNMHHAKNSIDRNKATHVSHITTNIAIINKDRSQT